MNKELAKNYAKIELAKREFFFFCHLKAPEFYLFNREYLIKLCEEIQSFYFSDEQILIVNMPPRHGKSFTASLFSMWAFGNNPKEQIMIGTYNETLSQSFSKTVRDSIAEQKFDPMKIIYNDIFPETRIKRGEAAMNRWTLQGHHSSYLATSPTGTATGFGATLLIIDDLIKNAEEANNEIHLEKIWRWFTDTMISRTEEKCKIIFFMTRWHSMDPSGRAKKHFEEIGIPVREIIMKALQDDGTMLCDEVLSRQTYENKIRTVSEDIASANYQQIPIDLKGKLWQKPFKEYSKLPDNVISRSAYIDTADEGADWLCMITYDETMDGRAYIVDIYYTLEPMEVTEVEVARRCVKHKINRVKIESNAGGRGFARAVARQLAEKFKNNYTVIKWFHQSKNKMARILTNSAWVAENCIFPENWRILFPEFYRDITKFQRSGKNKNDDCADCLTGVAENCGTKGHGVVNV